MPDRHNPVPADEMLHCDGVKHQHTVIAHIVILCPHRVYTTAADDRLVDLIVKFLYFIFHNLPHSIPFGTERSIRQDFEIVNLYIFFILDMQR